MNRFILGLLLSSFLGGCASLDNSPPKYIHEAWQKPGTEYKYSEVINDMQSCGYKDTATANDLSEQEVIAAETCMVSNGYVLDKSSYRPNNCYGKNSPYLCNKLWGGGKPESIPVTAKSQ